MVTIAIPILPRLRFKGDRTYIQGPDLFNAVQVALEGATGGAGWVRRASMRSMASGPVKLVAVQESASIGAFTCTSGSTTSEWGIAPDASAQPLEREEYDEDLVLRRTAIGSESAQFQGDLPFSVMEVITSVAKGLHQAIMPLEGARWIWVGVDLPRPLPLTGTRVSVTIQRRLGTRLTQSLIEIDSIPAGTLTFAAKPR